MPQSDWWPVDGTEPDPRWSLANERTLLAYSRTALGLVVAGLAIAGSHSVADLPVWVAVLGFPAIALGAAVAIGGRRRFLQTQRSMRLGEPLPAPLLASLLPLGIGLFAVAGFVVAAIELARSH
jgi:putative membrane protein